MSDPLPAWIIAARAGDTQAFVRLVEACQAGIRAYLSARLSDRHAADDLAQNAFIISYRRLAEFRDGESFPAWVRGIAHNLLRNHLRSRQAQTPTQDAGSLSILDDQAERMADRHDEQRLVETLRSCLAKLPDDQRQLVHARYVSEQSIEELCKSVGCKHSAMTMMLHRVRMRLRACVNDHLTEAAP
ncbi:MAG: sigma-70 family RNA polymerase sigma factor [Planctomycetes bacterium]|nr:sigma-70 family RNA polymerase sigma factor [Planctomycetota bacterium]